MQSYLTEWRIVFWISFGLFIVTTILFDIFASGETQDWNDPLKSKEESAKTNGTSFNVQANSPEKTI